MGRKWTSEILKFVGGEVGVMLLRIAVQAATSSSNSPTLFHDDEDEVGEGGETDLKGKVKRWFSSLDKSDGYWETPEARKVAKKAVVLGLIEWEPRVDDDEEE